MPPAPLDPLAQEAPVPLGHSSGSAQLCRVRDTRVSSRRRTRYDRRAPRDSSRPPLRSTGEAMCLLATARGCLPPRQPVWISGHLPALGPPVRVPAGPPVRCPSARAHVTPGPQPGDRPGPAGWRGTWFVANPRSTEPVGVVPIGPAGAHWRPYPEETFGEPRGSAVVGTAAPGGPGARAMALHKVGPWSV